MNRFLTILCIVCLSHQISAQIQGNAASIPESTNSFEGLSKITISTYFEKDSTGYKITCLNVEGKDAILVKVNKYKGLTADFHRSMSKSMLKQSLESLETEINIKTVFTGKYYLDIIDPNGIKIKTFIIEKTF